jgi:hypothetical protein
VVGDPDHFSNCERPPLLERDPKHSPSMSGMVYQSRSSFSRPPAAVRYADVVAAPQLGSRGGSASSPRPRRVRAAAPSLDPASEHSVDGDEDAAHAATRQLAVELVVGAQSVLEVLREVNHQRIVKKFLWRCAAARAARMVIARIERRTHTSDTQQAHHLDTICDENGHLSKNSNFLEGNLHFGLFVFGSSQ